MGFPGVSLARGDLGLRGAEIRAALEKPQGSQTKSGGMIPRLRDPTRHNSARKRESGRFARDDSWRKAGCDGMTEAGRLCREGVQPFEAQGKRTGPLRRGGIACTGGQFYWGTRWQRRRNILWRHPYHGVEQIAHCAASGGMNACPPYFDAIGHETRHWPGRAVSCGRVAGRDSESPGARGARGLRGAETGDKGKGSFGRAGRRHG